MANADGIERWQNVFHNKVLYAKHGYYVTKQPVTQAERKSMSWTKCRLKEREYFQEENCPWRLEKEEFLGTERLAQTLSKLLSKMIEEE
jgi:gamma-glutamyltranspeptidase